MATKLGEGYYDVFPQINQRAANAARDAIGEKLSRQFKDVNDNAVKYNEEGNAKIVGNDAKAAEQRIGSENKVRDTRKRNINSATKDENAFSRIQHGLAEKFQKDQSKNEGALHKLATQFRTVGTVAKGLTLGAGIASSFSLVQEAIGGIAAAAPIAAAGVALIPVAIAGTITEGLILKAAFKGVGKSLQDAFDPSKAKEFQKDLKSLSPAARSFVLEIAKAKGILPNIQQTFFSQKSLQEAGGRVASFFHTISGNLKVLVAANGNLFGRLLGDVTGNKGAAAINDFLGNIARFLREITPGIAALGAGFIQFLDHMSQVISGGGINKFLINFGAWLARINTGKLFAAADAAFKSFGFILKQVWGTLTGIFKALGGNQGTTSVFFKNIGGLFTEINKFVNSGNGQRFLKELIGTLDALSGLADVAIKDALAFLAGAFAKMYPAIKPFVNEVEKVLNDLVPLGPLIGSVLAGAFKSLTTALKTVEPILKRVINYLTTHQAEVASFADKILLLVGAYLALKKAIGIAQPILSLVGSLKELPAPILAGAAALAIIAAAVIYTYTHSKLFRDMVADLKTHLDDLGHALGFNGGALKTWFGIAKGIVMGFLIADIILLNAVIIGLTKTIEGAKRAFDDMKHWLLTGWDAVERFFTVTFPGWFVTGFNAVEGAFNSVAGFFTTWYNRVAHFFSSTIPGFFTKTMPGWFTTMAHAIEGVFNSLSQAIANWYNHVAQFLTKTVPGFFTKTVPGWFSTMYRSVTGWFTNTYNSIVRWWTNTFHYMTRSIPGFITKTVPGWFNSLYVQILTIFNKIWTAAKNIVNEIIHTFTGSWGGVEKAFTGIVNAIAKPVKKLIDIVYTKGIKKFWDSVAKPLGNKVMDALSFVNPFAGGGVVSRAVKGFKDGGPISRALGGPTQDNVYLQGRSGHPGINVSGGEYVLRAKAVKAIGLGYLNVLNKQGGAQVGGDPSGIHVLGKGQRYAGGGGVPGGANAQVGPTLSWLKSIAGRVPYVLGANGPNAFDCSSLVGNVWARLTGNARNRRYFVTGTENGWLLNHGFAPGGDPGGFTVGLTSPPEHTVGILAGHRFEAAHTGTRMRFDDGAANAMGFSKKYHMVGISSSGGFGLTGILAKIAAMKGQMKTYMQDPVQKEIDGLTYNAFIPSGLAASISKSGPGGGRGAQAKQILGVVQDNATDRNVKATSYLQAKLDAAAAAAAASFGDAGATNLSAGANASQEEAWIAAASKYVNIPASWVPGFLKLIAAESGGNPNAINRTDSNARRGDPSIGIVQMIRSTFEEFRDRRLPDNRRDPVAEIAAAANYIKWHYGSIYNTPYYHGHTYYAEGGPVTKASPVLTRDHGGPVYPGMNHIWNGTGANEYINDPTQSGGDVYVILDGVDVTSRAHVTKNNKQVAASLKRRSKL